MTRSALVMFLLSMMLGCVSVRPIAPGALPELAAGEGILVVHIQTTVPITRLDLSQAAAGTNLVKGEHFYLLAVSAGQHRWTRIIIPAGKGDVTFPMASGDDWAFRVAPGRVNYPGQFVFGGKTRSDSVEISDSRRLDRSAQALRRLRVEYPELLRRYPPIYAGPTRDDFLAYFGRTFLAKEALADDTGAR